MYCKKIFMLLLALCSVAVMAQSYSIYKEKPINRGDHTMNHSGWQGNNFGYGYYPKQGYGYHPRHGYQNRPEHGYQPEHHHCPGHMRPYDDPRYRDNDTQKGSVLDRPSVFDKPSAFNR